MDRDELMGVLAYMRPFVERAAGLSSAVDAGPGMAGFCRGASAALLAVLDPADPGGMWRIAGGCGEECVPLPPLARRHVISGLFPGGMIDTDGVWRGHFWVEGMTSCGSEVILDLTADQFGYDRITVIDRDDPRYRANLLSTYEPLVACERAWGARIAKEVVASLSGAPALSDIEVEGYAEAA